MAAGEKLTARARAALDLVSRDRLARDKFMRAYTGTGNAILSLRAAADPSAGQVADPRLDALVRIAFGRTLNAAEEEAARAARQALHDEERLRAQDADALDRAIRALGTEPAPNPSSSAELAATRPAGVLRRAWFVPVAESGVDAGPRLRPLGRHPVHDLVRLAVGAVPRYTVRAGRATNARSMRRPSSSR